MCCSSFPNFVDTNECSTVSPCHANATCNNTEGSYTCTCDSGYSGDGVSCNGRRFTNFNTELIPKTSIKNLNEICRDFFISKHCRYRRMFNCVTMSRERNVD